MRSIATVMRHSIAVSLLVACSSQTATFSKNEGAHAGAGTTSYVGGSRNSGVAAGNSGQSGSANPTGGIAGSPSGAAGAAATALGGVWNAAGASGAASAIGGATPNGGGSAGTTAAAAIGGATANSSLGGASPNVGSGGTAASGGGSTAPTLVLALTATSIDVPFDRSASLNVSIARTGGFSGPVSVSVALLPANVTATPITIEANQSSGVIVLNATGLSTPGAEATNVEVTATDGSNLISKKTITVRIVGQPGQLDSTFKQNGVLTVAYDTTQNPTFDTAAVLTDGSLMVGCHFPADIAGHPAAQIQKYFANGSGNGAYAVNVAFSDPPFRTPSFDLFSILPDGRAFFLVQSVDITPTIPLFRSQYYAYTAAGVPDAAFDSDGIAQVASSISGGPVQGAWVDPSTAEPVFCVRGGATASNNVVRRLADSTQDPNWSGAALDPSHLGKLYAGDENGRLIVATTSGAVYRFVASGSPDINWGTGHLNGSNNVTYYYANLRLGGKVATFADIATADGKNYALGYALPENGSAIGVVALNGTGGLDTTFGTSGETVALNPGSGTLATAAKLLIANQKIYVLGSNLNSTSPQVVLARYTLSGTLDASFGSAGVVLRGGFSTAGNTIRPFALGMQGDKLMVFVEYSSSTQKSLLVYRYWL